MEPTDISFEDALAELERIVRALDAGQSSLEASLRDYEKGIRLLRFCHATLQNAERRIEILKTVNPDGSFMTEPAAESQFSTDTTQPGQHRSAESEREPVRKKRVRKAAREFDVEETNDIPFDFD
jgi:exodeoxyribonuclease VII small subunit